jgi:hypothetical protein
MDPRKRKRQASYRPPPPDARTTTAARAKSVSEKRRGGGGDANQQSLPCTTTTTMVTTKTTTSQGPRLRTIAELKAAMRSLIESSGLVAQTTAAFERHRDGYARGQEELRKEKAAMDRAANDAHRPCRGMEESCRKLTERVEASRMSYLKHLDDSRWLGLFNTFLLGDKDENECIICTSKLSRKSLVILRCSHMLCMDCFQGLEFHDVEGSDWARMGLSQDNGGDVPPSSSTPVANMALKRCPSCRHYVLESHSELTRPRRMARDRVREANLQTVREYAESLNGTDLWSLWAENDPGNDADVVLNDMDYDDGAGEDEDGDNDDRANSTPLTPSSSSSEGEDDWGHEGEEGWERDGDEDELGSIGGVGPGRVNHRLPSNSLMSVSSSLLALWNGRGVANGLPRRDNRRRPPPTVATKRRRTNPSMVVGFF